MNNTNIIWYIYIPASYHLLKGLSFSLIPNISLRRKQKSRAKIGFINILGYSERIPIFLFFFSGRNTHETGENTDENHDTGENTQDLVLLGILPKHHQNHQKTISGRKKH